MLVPAWLQTPPYVNEKVTQLPCPSVSLEERLDCGRQRICEWQGPAQGLACGQHVVELLS